MNTNINDCNVAPECAKPNGEVVMTDRELLELAAKAAGLVGECHLLLGDCSDPEEPGGFRYKHPDGGHDWWNPLMDDGDALRLAVKLKLLICSEDCMAMHHEYKGDRHTDWFGGHPENEHVGIDHDEFDPFAATRLAIVRAAAEIGKGL